MCQKLEVLQISRRGFAATIAVKANNERAFVTCMLIRGTAFAGEYCLADYEFEGRYNLSEFQQYYAINAGL